MTRGAGVDDQPRAARVDARSERWRAHRVRVRAEFVEAAFQALDAQGPDISMGDIAKAAGAAKPKLYRHFRDKADLCNAVLDRVRDMLWERVLADVDLSNHTVAELIHRGVTAYVEVVGEHPNVFRFVLRSTFEQASSDGQALNTARSAGHRAAEFLGAWLPEGTLGTHQLELINYSVFGAVVSATDWWLGTEGQDSVTLDVDRFADYLTRSIIALAQSGAEFHDLPIDLTSPLHSAFDG